MQKDLAMIKKIVFIALTAPLLYGGEPEKKDSAKPITQEQAQELVTLLAQRAKHDEEKKRAREELEKKVGEIQEARQLQEEINKAVQKTMELAIQHDWISTVKEEKICSDPNSALCQQTIAELKNAQEIIKKLNDYQQAYSRDSEKQWGWKSQIEDASKYTVNGTRYPNIIVQMIDKVEKESKVKLSGFRKCALTVDISQKLPLMKAMYVIALSSKQDEKLSFMKFIEKEVIPSLVQEIVQEEKLLRAAISPREDKDASTKNSAPEALKDTATTK